MSAADTANSAAVAPSPSEAVKTEEQKMPEGTAPQPGGAPLHLVAISGGTSGKYEVREHDQEQLGSSPGIVPDIPECPTPSDAPGCYWPAEEEIRAELLWARFLKQAEIDRFVERGVKASALYISGAVVVDQVVFQDNGLFEFGRNTGDMNAQNAFIFEVRGVEGLTDLAAWDPYSSQCALWLGRGFALGESQVWFPTLSGGPLRIWRSPLGWLRAYRDGLVILNPRAAYWYLCDVPALAAEDANHRKQISRMLIPPQPRIVVAPSAQATS
jgi:hypothetical protein